MMVLDSGDLSVVERAIVQSLMTIGETMVAAGFGVGLICSEIYWTDFMSFYLDNGHLDLLKSGNVLRTLEI